MSTPIEDYALIGDGQTAALVNRNGSIDWLCWPTFDSDACFAALLGTEQNGRWSIAPEGDGHSSRRYQEDTLVLETDIEASTGTLRIIDFMPARTGTHSSLVRIVRGLAGRVQTRLDLRLRFDYGALPPWCERHGRGMTAQVGSARIIFDSPVDIEISNGGALADFTVAEGEAYAFSLNYDLATSLEPPTIDAHAALHATQNFWREWIGQFDVSRTRWPETVKRSLITLRAMVHGGTGALVAAPTAGLPEVPGGDMNWDYRYCWLRDATFTLSALVNAGYKQEATQWRDWLLRAIAGSPEQVRIMYRVDGTRHLDEWFVGHLDGWRGAVPVRIGNAAGTQHQIDVLGELIDGLSFARTAGIPITDQHDQVERRIVEHLERVWYAKDSGVWEARGRPRHYTYSKAMAWVGFSRALKDGIIKDKNKSAELTALAKRIHAEVCRNGFNEGLNTFTQAYGTHDLDGSLLLMPLVGFLPANDPRMAATIDKIGRELDEGGLIRRTKAMADGPNEGAFLPCSCWMADCLSLQGRRDEAEAQFERLLAVANDVGLMSEEYNVAGKHLVGNFPQALTHLAVVNTALGLSGSVLHHRSG